MKKILLLLLSFISLQLSAQTWTQLGAPPANYEARNHPITFSIGDFGYITTGAGQFYNSDFYRYNPSDDSWTQLANFPGGARSFGYGVENNGKGYVGFGLVGTQSGAIYYDDLWEFDPTNNSWTQLATCPGSGRRHPAMVATPGKIFVGCGDGPTGNLKDWWEYDIASNTWSQKPDLPSFQRHHPYFFEINGEAYVGFGHNGASIYKDMYKYNPSAQTWTAIPNLPAQGRVAGTQFSYDGKGYLLSGQGENHNNLATGEMWVYDAATNAWTSSTAHPGTGRWAPGSFLIGNRVFLTSGAGFGNSQIDIADMWSYDLPVALSTRDLKKNNNINFFPNPATDVLNVSITRDMQSIEVFNIYGSKVNVGINTSLQGQAQIDLSELSAGIYILKIQDKETISTKEFVKQY